MGVSRAVKGRCSPSTQSWKHAILPIAALMAVVGILQSSRVALPNDPHDVLDAVPNPVIQAEDDESTVVDSQYLEPIGVGGAANDPGELNESSESQQGTPAFQSHSAPHNLVQTSTGGVPLEPVSRNPSQVNQDESLPAPMLTHPVEQVPTDTNKLHSNVQRNEPNREPRFFWGIASTGGRLEYTRRDSIRRTYLSYFKTTTRPDRICSWNALTRNQVDHPEECQFAYAFFLGANPTGRTELVSCNDDCPTMTTNASMLVHNDSIYNNTDTSDYLEEEDVIYLNIRENQFEGKMETWFKFATESIRNSTNPNQRNRDYVVKADSDTILYPPEFLHFAETSLPLPAKLVYSGLRNDPHTFDVQRPYKDGGNESYCQKRERQGKHCNDYIVGQAEILSLDLAEYVVSPQCSRAELMNPMSEDLSLGDYVWSYPEEAIHFIPFDSPHNLWLHTQLSKNPTTFRKLWFQYLKSRVIRNLDPNQPRFVLMNVPYSGSLALLFQTECWHESKVTARACFDSYLGRWPPPISDQTVALVLGKSFSKDDPEPALLDTDGTPTATLWVLRHPLHRMNAFFDKVATAWSKRFLKCFKRIETWLEATLQGFPTSTDNTVTQSCTGMELEEAMNNMNSYLQHLQRGFSATKSLPTYVIRLDRFMEDIHHLESTYSHNDDDNGVWDQWTPQVWERLKKVHVNKTYDSPTPIATTLKQAACCHAKNEVWVYRTLIEQAVNLDEISKRESLEYLALHCGRETLDPSSWDCSIIQTT